MFLVDDDREQLANDLRSLKSQAVIIDHFDPGRIERFAQLRTEVGSGTRIIATLCTAAKEPAHAGGRRNLLIHPYHNEAGSIRGGPESPIYWDSRLFAR